MDGILGKAGTGAYSHGSCPAKKLRPGQAIRFEFGAPDNWIRLEIREVHISEKQVTLKGKGNGYQDGYSFQPDGLVEVLDGR